MFFSGHSLKRVAVGAVHAQLCPTLCYPMDCILPGSSVHGIFQAGVLEWVAISYSRGSSWPSDRILTSGLYYNGRWILYHWRHLGSPKGSYQIIKHNFLKKLSRGACNNGVLLARVLEWVAVPFSRRSSQPRDHQTQVSRIAGGFFTTWATREALINPPPPK